ncbi:hypothetical protein [Kitasatospora sp. NPDC127060]|uniref:hypothetical protein n=1 Tax=Kitasatospora sp. NPDC127060 TaxID=3347121 RepID=UPI0036500BDD
MSAHASSRATSCRPAYSRGPAALRMLRVRWVRQVWLVRRIDQRAQVCGILVLQ